MTSNTVSFSEYLKGSIAPVTFVHNILQEPFPRTRLDAIIKTITTHFVDWQKEPRLKTLHDISACTLQNMPEKEQFTPTGSLDTLPLENLQQIAHHVPLRSLLQLNMTCHSFGGKILSIISYDETKLGEYLSQLILKKNEPGIDRLLDATGSFPLKTPCHVRISPSWPRIPLVLHNIQKKFPALGITIHAPKASTDQERIEIFLGNFLFSPILNLPILYGQLAQIIFAACPNLCELYLPPRVSIQALDAISTLSNLTELSIQSSLTEYQFSSITTHCPKLKKLFLSQPLFSQEVTSFHPRHLEVLEFADDFSFSQLHSLLSRDPSNGVVLTQLAHHQNTLADHAKTYAEKALTLMPNYAEAHSFLGTHSHDLVQAENHLLEAYRIYPSNPTYCYQLAMLYAQNEKNLDYVIFLYKKTLKIEPNHVQAILNLAEIYCTKRKQPELAKDLLEQAMRDCPYNLAFLNLVATHGPTVGISRHTISGHLKLAARRFPRVNRIQLLNKKFTTETPLLERLSNLVTDIFSPLKSFKFF